MPLPCNRSPLKRDFHVYGSREERVLLRIQSSYKQAQQKEVSDGKLVQSIEKFNKQAF